MKYGRTLGFRTGEKRSFENIENKYQMFKQEYARVAMLYPEKKDICDLLSARVEEGKPYLIEKYVNNHPEMNIEPDDLDLPIVNYEDSTFANQYFSIPELVLIQTGLHDLIDPGTFTGENYEVRVRKGFLYELNHKYFKAYIKYQGAPLLFADSRAFYALGKSKEHGAKCYKDAMKMIEEKNFDSGYYDLLILASEENNMEAKCELGLINYYGLYGVEENKKEGVKYLLDSARMGDVKAVLEIIKLYDEGEELVDVKDAYYLTVNNMNQSQEIAARFSRGFDLRDKEDKYLERFESGDKRACWKLFKLYMKRHDLDNAYKYLQLSLDNKIVDAYLYCIENASTEDDKYRLTLLAAKANHIPSIYEIANSCLRGNAKHFYEITRPRKVKEYHLEEFKWIKKAAKLGDPLANTYVAIAYKNGYPVEKDYKKAFKYAEKGYTVDNPFGKHVMGTFYEEGIGCDVDMAKASECFKA